MNHYLIILANKKFRKQRKWLEDLFRDFVSIEEGTGVVHIAPAFGEDDLKLGQIKKLPLFNMLM